VRITVLDPEIDVSRFVVELVEMISMCTPSRMLMRTVSIGAAE
jgi:hypothetical protein